MDFKGVTWAGNIYQKFEAMCLEVEEVMYEDTVKYMENQVQKVGVSVKKFYSEVINEFAPPSSADPAKVAAGDLSLNPYAHIDINKKPKMSILGELTKKEIEDEHFFNDRTQLSPPSCKVFVESTCPEAFSTKSKKMGMHKRPIGIRRISQNNHPQKVSPPATTSVQVKTMMQENDNSNCTSPASDKIISPQPLMQKKDDDECTSSSSQGLPTEPIDVPSPQSGLGSRSDAREFESREVESVGKDDVKTSDEDKFKKDSSVSQSGSSSRSDAHKVESVENDVEMSDEDKFREDSSASQITSNISSHTHAVEPVDDKVIVSRDGLDNFGIERIENEEDDTFKPVEKSKLEETCIWVEGDELHFVPQGTKKHKSYKKKLREALSLRLTRKQEQQRVSQYKDLVGKSDQEMVIPSLTMDDNLESEWELL